MSALNQAPSAFNILRWFNAPRNAGDMVNELQRTIQPTFDITAVTLLDRLRGADLQGAVALGSNLLFSNDNTEGAPDLVYGISTRAPAALGAGVAISGVHYVQRMQAPGLLGLITTTPFGDRWSYVAGEWAYWGFTFPSNAPLVLMKGDQLGFWCTSLAGASPVFNHSYIHNVLTS